MLRVLIVDDGDADADVAPGGGGGVGIGLWPMAFVVGGAGTDSGG